MAQVQVRGRSRLVMGALSLMLAAGGFLAGLTSPGGVDLSDVTPIAAASPASAESEFVRLLNQTRAANGKQALMVNPDLAATSRTWSAAMQSRGTLSHDPNLAAVATRVVPNWTRVGENVGLGYDVAGLHKAFWDSTGHRANMLGDYNQVGVGVTNDAKSRIWVTLRFVKGPLPAGGTAGVTDRPDRVGIRRNNAYYLRYSLTSGAAQLSFGYGLATDQVVMGDWDGNGVATPGVFRNGTWYLRNRNTSGTADVTLSYGQLGDIPLVGDWDGNGTDTVGVWRNGQFLLRNANSTGSPTITVDYGTLTDRPLVGDWDGNRTDTIGVWRDRQFLLRNANSGGAANVAFAFGSATDLAIIGDWDGNGTDTPGIRRGNAFYLRNHNSGGGSDVSFGYGTAQDQVVVGSW